MASVVVEVASWWLEFEEGVVVVMRAFFGCGGVEVVVGVTAMVESVKSKIDAANQAKILWSVCLRLRY